MPTILHITSRQAWDDAQEVGHYEAPSLHSQGYIHCSTQEQVVGVANIRFKDHAELVLLCIESDEVGAEIRYENCEGGTKLFPHVYGQINLGSITNVVPFKPNPEGVFELPEAVRAMYG